MNIRPGPNIFLIGFMASGKTTVGRILATQLQRRFLDTDVEIERLAGRSIPAIFDEDGEEGFRRMEARVLARAAKRRKRVIAVGAGALMRPGNASLIKRQGLVVFLDCALRRMVERSERQGAWRRPLCAGDSCAERFIRMRRLYQKRLPVYRRFADIVVRVWKDRPDAIAARICERLRKP